MNRRWIALAVIAVAIIGVANVFILLVLVPRWSKAASTSAPAPVPAAAEPAPNKAPAAQMAAAPVAAVPVAAAPVSSTAVTSQPVAAAPHHPKPPPVQPGMRVERQVMTPSGQLRVRYLRDRQQGIREISVQDAKNPANETVLTQYQRNAWVVVSPNDDWIILETREKGSSDIQLFQRVSASPLKYETPTELRANGSELRDVIWQTYLDQTQQDPNLNPRRVTIDATGWEPDSQKVNLSIAPVPSKENAAAIPMAWTCVYNVQTKQIETPDGQVAEAPAEENASGAPDEIAAAQGEQPPPEDAAAAENPDATAPDQASQDMEGEKFPATREQEITVADANELELADVKYAIYEMFARHGAQIDDTKMRQTFSQFPWYQPQEGLTFEAAEKEFSDVEKHNLDVLRRVRAAKIAASHRSERKPLKGQVVPEQSDGERFLRGVLQGVSDALNGGDQ